MQALDPKTPKNRFQLSNGLEGVVPEHGVAQIPVLRRIPDFNVEQELSSVSEFVLEPVGAPRRRPRSREPLVSRNSRPCSARRRPRLPSMKKSSPQARLSRPF